MAPDQGAKPQSTAAPAGGDIIPPLPPVQTTPSISPTQASPTVGAGVDLLPEVPNIGSGTTQQAEADQSSDQRVQRAVTRPATSATADRDAGSTPAQTIPTDSANKEQGNVGSLANDQSDSAKSDITESRPAGARTVEPNMPGQRGVPVLPTEQTAGDANQASQDAQGVGRGQYRVNAGLTNGEQPGDVDAGQRIARLIESPADTSKPIAPVVYRQVDQAEARRLKELQASLSTSATTPETPPKVNSISIDPTPAQVNQKDTSPQHLGTFPTQQQATDFAAQKPGRKVIPMLGGAGYAVIQDADQNTQTPSAGESLPSERGAVNASNAQGAVTTAEPPATASQQTGRTGSQPQTSTQSAGAMVPFVDRGSVPNMSYANVRDMVEAAGRQYPNYAQKVRALAASIPGATADIGPVKTIARVTEKSKLENENNHNRVWDVLRSTIVVEHVEDVNAVIEAVKAQYQVYKFKDRFATAKTGYRAVIITVAQPGYGMAEIQITTQAIYKAKHQWYKWYEQTRVMPQTSERRVRLQAKMDQAYDWAYEASKRRRASQPSLISMTDALTSRRNSASSTSNVVLPGGSIPQGGNNTNLPPQAPKGRPSGAGNNTLGESSLSKNRVPGGGNLSGMGNGPLPGGMTDVDVSGEGSISTGIIDQATPQVKKNSVESTDNQGDSHEYAASVVNPRTAPAPGTSSKPQPGRGSDAEDLSSIRRMGQDGRPGTLIVNDGSEHQVRYALIDASALIPSHDARANFSINQAGDANERRYDHPTEGRAGRQTVLAIAAKPNIALLTTDTPTPIDGPPIVTPSGVVLGGNARSMAIQLAYHQNGASAQAICSTIYARSSNWTCPVFLPIYASVELVPRQLDSQHQPLPVHFS